MCGESVLRPGLVRLEWLVRLEGLVRKVGDMGLVKTSLVPKPSHCPGFDRLQYAKQKKYLVPFIK